MPEHRTTTASGVLGLAGDEPAVSRREPIGVARTARAITRLAHAHSRLRHVPTVEQIRSMAWFDGREPCSYLLDPEHNYVPELPADDKEDPVGRYGLCFTCRDAAGRPIMELVALSNGWAFDLLGPFV